MRLLQLFVSQGALARDCGNLWATMNEYRGYLPEILELKFSVLQPQQGLR